jgi:integrase
LKTFVPTSRPEVVAPEVCDIDSKRMVIRIERSKGDKERYAMLSVQLLRILRAYWRLAQCACGDRADVEAASSIGGALLLRRAAHGGRFET